MIDIYCERTGPGLWAEPLNAVTNLAFIASAVLLARALLRHADDRVSRDPALWTLVGLVFLIGIGSGLFHTLATRWALLADTIPITVFMLSYTYLALRRFVGLGPWPSLVGVIIVLALREGVPEIVRVPGGSYLPALVILLGLGLYVRLHRKPESGNAMLTAGCLFALSLGLRTMDRALCDSVPIGTHFLWHLLNALVLFIVTRAMIRSPR